MESAITTAIASTTGAVSTAFSANIGSVMVVFGALVAFGLLIRLIKRLIGRRA